MKYLVNEEIFQNVVRSAEDLDSALGELSQVPPDDTYTGYYLHLQRVRREVVMLKSFLEAHVEVCSSPRPAATHVPEQWTANFLWLEVLPTASRTLPPALSLDHPSFQSVA